MVIEILAPSGMYIAPPLPPHMVSLMPPRSVRLANETMTAALIVTTRKGLLSEASARITAPAGERIATSRSMLRVEESENGPLLPSSMMVLTALSASELCMTPELRSDDVADDIVTVYAAAGSTHRAEKIKTAVSPGEKAEDRAVRQAFGDSMRAAEEKIIPAG